MSEYEAGYGASGGQMLRRAVLWTIGCGALAVTVPRFVPSVAGALSAAAPAAPKPAAPRAQQRWVETYRAGKDGQFFIAATVNNAPVRFVLDTGAYMVTLTPEAARGIGLNLGALRYDTPVSTANGKTYHAAVTLDEIRLGGIVERDVPALVMQQASFASLLGMSFLSRLDSWQIHDGVLTIAY